jgi:hypothetical protein
MLAPAHILRNRCEQRHSNRSDLDSSVTGGVGKSLLHGGGPAYGFIFGRKKDVIVVGLRFKWHALYFHVFKNDGRKTLLLFHHVTTSLRLNYLPIE